ncbi:MAG TPA: hypothetical protein VKV37_10080 [Ktedonobacteraceae bacterium]|jgi:hypothetical protein|nr:hypothetical protein [Ktedonobacteraceae bacterium]
MEAEEILERARAGNEIPDDWLVFPILRNKLIVGMIGWIFGIIVGLGLFVVIANIVIPVNYQHGVFAAVITTIILGVCLFIGLGSIWTFITDLLRLRHMDRHLIVVTPEDFVKQEGKKIIHVPLINIRHVTARGVPPPDRDPSGQDNVRQVPGVGENAAAFFFGRGFVPSGSRWRRKRMRTPTSLAFIDTRTNREVTVVNDSAYGDPFTIAALLKQYAAAVQQLVR